MSLLNWGGGLSAMGGAVATLAGTAAVAQQKSDLEKQQAVLADHLATTRETNLAHVQGAEARDTATTTAGAQGAQTRETQDAANKLPMTAAQIAQDKINQGTLTETERTHRATEGTTGWDMFQDDDGGSYRVNPGKGVTQKMGDGGVWQDMTKPPSNLHRVGQPSQETFSPEMSGIMGALAERGISLPTGLRSKQQQIALYKSLLERNPGKSADEIADGVKDGQIQFGAEKKATTVAAGIAGRVKYAEEELTGSIPLVREMSAKVDRGNFVPITKLLQMGDTQISDPNLRALKLRITSVLNAYDMLASRGGTDVGKRNEAHALLTSADSPEVLDAALDSFELEAAVAKKAARNAMRIERDKPGAEVAPGAASPTPATPKTPPLPTGVPSGSQYSASRNQWRDPSGKFYDADGKEAK